MENMNPEQDFVLKTVESRDVHFIRLWFTDALGHMKSMAVVPGELAVAFSDGMGFDGSCIEGFMPSQESDILAFPDAATFQVLPWRPASNAVARMFCNLKTPDGMPFEGDPRNVLQRMVKKAERMGFELNVGPELEFFYFQNQESTVPLDNGGYFDLTSLDHASDLRRDTVLTLEKMGIPVEYSYHAMAPSQHEIDLRYADALSMADSVMTYKLVVKEIAIRHGVHASFMPKPLADQAGSGMHVHMSLWDESGRNVFFDENDEMGYNLSKTAKCYIAGIMKYAREFCLVTNQFVNSYKRLNQKSEAPIAIAWSRRNRSTMVRVPGYRPDSPYACRVELRNPDPAANPYLAFSVMLAAGLAGIEEELELEAPVENTDMRAMSRLDLRNAGIEVLPATLREAIELFAESDLMKRTLGEHIHSFLVDAKRAECEEYEKQVTPWELDRCLAVL